MHMCLFTGQICPQRARKDIVCYKVVRRLSEHLFQTPYLYYMIKGKLPITLQIDNTQRIERLSVICSHYSFKYMISGGMFHAYTGLTENVHNIALLCSNRIIVKCIIPKGTLYYKGVNDICARTLILQEIV